MASGTARKTDPKLWEKVKARVTRGTKGGDAGEWSARKAQLAVAEYKKAGGGYEGGKKADNHLSQWTKEEWGTKSGRESGKTGERYLPKKAREGLSDDEYARTTAAKRRDTAKGKQFSAQPADVARKTATARDTGKPAAKRAATKDAPAKAAPRRAPAARKTATKAAAKAPGRAAPGTAGKTAARKPAAAKRAAPARKAAAEKAPARKAPARKTPARKTAAKAAPKAPAKRAPASRAAKAPAKAPARRAAPSPRPAKGKTK
ncbi:hypothetical protein [Muricoccus nepalensis]|uniref:hypothetical protein n=1 Tax=Muricoccus nepalensis TaxID=1854500 RepID=UPI0019D5D3B3|nr:hypothetical protein [Roseomonas nepalensis]